MMRMQRVSVCHLKPQDTQAQAVGKAGAGEECDVIKKLGTQAEAIVKAGVSCPPSTHQVSTIGQRRSPTTSWYQRQACSLMGSPTVPSTRSEERS